MCSVKTGDQNGLIRCCPGAAPPPCVTLGPAVGQCHETSACLRWYPGEGVDLLSVARLLIHTILSSVANTDILRSCQRSQRLPRVLFSALLYANGGESDPYPPLPQIWGLASPHSPGLNVGKPRRHRAGWRWFSVVGSGRGGAWSGCFKPPPSSSRLIARRPFPLEASGAAMSVTGQGPSTGGASRERMDPGAEVECLAGLLMIPCRSPAPPVDDLP